MLQNYLVKKTEIPEGDMVLADINNDGAINVFDLISMKGIAD